MKPFLTRSNQERNSPKKERWLWGIAIGLVAIPVLLVVEQVWPGWGRVSVLTAIVFGYLAADFRPVWAAVRFWILLSAFLAMHLLGISWLKSAIDDYTLLAMLLIGLGEVFLFSWLIALSLKDEDFERLY